jgi:hypothetical protein
MNQAWPIQVAYITFHPAMEQGGGVDHPRTEAASRWKAAVMADFKTHITGSTLIGIGLGAVGLRCGFSPETCLLATGLCSVSGILPDLDSSSGVPYRESVAFISAFVPVLLIQRFQHLGWNRETIVLAVALIYIGIRFGVGEIFRRYTVHRGMWHSIPAAASIGLLFFLITDSQNLNLRLYWSAAAVIGFMTHLLLDELYSVDFRGVRLKKSFGTALKFWTSNGLWPNISTYGKLAILIFLVWSDPTLGQPAPQQDSSRFRTARQVLESLERPASSETGDVDLRR